MVRFRVLQGKVALKINISMAQAVKAAQQTQHLQVAVYKNALVILASDQCKTAFVHCLTVVQLKKSKVISVLHAKQTLTQTEAKTHNASVILDTKTLTIVAAALKSAAQRTNS